MEDIITRYVNLPPSVKACTAADENGDYNVYINCRISAEEQRKALAHELAHIEKGHFFSSVPLSLAEAEAEEAGEAATRISKRENQENRADRTALDEDAPDYLYRLRTKAKVSREKIEKILKIGRNEYALYEFGKKPCPAYIKNAIVLLLKKYSL